jgi:hypothetical protein
MTEEDRAFNADENCKKFLLEILKNDKELKDWGYNLEE